MPHLPAHTILGVLHDFEEGGGPRIVKYENTDVGLDLDLDGGLDVGLNGICWP